MSENKLEARNKFVSKLEKKINEMNESIQLLAKVDEKLLLKQTGGTDSTGLYTLGISIANLDARAAAWKTALTASTKLNDRLNELNKNVALYQKRITDIIDNLDIPSKDTSKLDEFLSMNKEAYEAAKDAYAKAYSLTKKGEENQLVSFKEEFKNEVNKLGLDSSKSGPLITEFNNKLQDIINKLPN